MEYNAENRPVHFRRERNTAEDPEVSLVMKYDFRGRRTVKTAFVDGVMADSRKFVYDDFLLVAELRSRNTEESGYALHQTFMWDSAERVATRPLCMTCWRNGAHEDDATSPLNYTLECFNKKQSDIPFWVDDSTSGRYFYIQDHNKNVKGIMNGMGTLVGEYDYSAFGGMVTSTANDITSSNPFRFSSEYYDRELRMCYYNYRHFNPEDGRWISRDPIKRIQENRYLFLNNNPMAICDFLGLIMTPDQGQRWTDQLIDDVKVIDNQTYSLSPEDGENACAGYDFIPDAPCKYYNGKFIEDTYPKFAKEACLGFVKMYTRNGKTRDAVVCTAMCLVSSERQNRKHKCCDKRNAARLDSHVYCYLACGFIMDFSKENLGVPYGGWDVCFTSLFPSWLFSLLNLLKCK